MENTFTPEQQKMIDEMIQNQISTLFKNKKYIFTYPTQFIDGRNIQLGTATGTQIGTSATQKLGVYGVTPIIQASGITAPSGGTTIDIQARTAINSLITAIKNFGITS